MTPEDEKQSEAGLGRWAWEWAKSLSVALVLYLFLRTFVIAAFQIPTGSMEDSLLVGDYLLVNKLAYGAEVPGTDVHLPGYDRPELGEIVVFEPPPEAGQPPGTSYVKRIVGLPGDTLAMRDGTLYRNGEPVKEPYAHQKRIAAGRTSPAFAWQRKYLVGDSIRPKGYRPTLDNWGPIRVPEARYFLMGDNRDNSQDSRYWGFVPARNIQGDPLFIYYSYDREELAPFPWITEIRWGRLFEGIH